jgi:hypothetical protein
VNADDLIALDDVQLAESFVDAMNALAAVATT